MASGVPENKNIDLFVTANKIKNDRKGGSGEKHQFLDIFGAFLTNGDQPVCFCN